MGGAEGVVFAFGPLGEARQPARLAQGANPVAPAGENLVGIALVADVPDQPVGWRIEDVMQGNGQFDHPKPGAKVSAGDRNGGNRFLAQFVGQRPQIRFGKLAQVRWHRHAVEQGS